MLEAASCTQVNEQMAILLKDYRPTAQTKPIRYLNKGMELWKTRTGLLVTRCRRLVRQVNLSEIAQIRLTTQSEPTGTEIKVMIGFEILSKLGVCLYRDQGCSFVVEANRISPESNNHDFEIPLNQLLTLLQWYPELNELVTTSARDCRYQNHVLDKIKNRLIEDLNSQTNLPKSSV